MRFGKLKFLLLFLPLFFLFPYHVQAEETIIDGAVLYQYQAKKTDGTSFLKAKDGIIFPAGADKIDEVYVFFHGINPPCSDCHLITPVEACKEFELCKKVTEMQTLKPQTVFETVNSPAKNVAIFIPQMDPQSGNHASQFTRQEFIDYLNEAMTQLHSRIPNSPNRISVIAGHSAGAGIIARYIEEFKPEKVLVFDGCYGSWCKKILDSNKITDTKYIYISTTNNYDRIHEESGMQEITTASHPRTAVVRNVPMAHYQVPSRCFLDHLTDDKCAKPTATDQQKKTVEIEKLVSDINKAKPKFEINFPGVNFRDASAITDDTGTYIFVPWLAQFISAIYKFGIAIASIVAVITIILQGVRILTSAGNSEATSEGYKKISHAAIGLLIAWGSFAILYNINPKLVQFNALKVKVVEHQELDVSASDEDPVDSGSIQTNGTVPYFGQFEKPWNKFKPGDPEWPFDTSKCKKTSTIQDRGCGPTSLAMVLKYLGKDVTPINTANFALGCSGPMDPNMVQSNWSKSPWSDLKFEMFYGSSQAEKALSIAAQGYPIIFNCHPCVGYTGDEKLKTYAPGHFMVITGSTDGGKTFTINDPGGNPKINNSIVKMTRDQILDPQQYQAEAGCQSAKNPSDCLNGIDKIRKPPPFIYVHK